MIVAGESEFVSVRSGQKNGKSWNMVKFLDNAADEFFTAFVDDELAAEFQNMSKHTPVVLTLNLVPGQKFFSLESVEIMK